MAQVTNVVAFLQAGQGRRLLGLRRRRRGARLVSASSTSRGASCWSSAPRAAACGRWWRAPATRSPPIPMEPPVESLNVSVGRGAVPLRGAAPARAAAARRAPARAAVSGTLYIVDGYNVLHALFRGAEKEEIFARRDWLADQPRELRRAARGAGRAGLRRARPAQHQQRAHQGRAGGGRASPAGASRPTR